MKLLHVPHLQVSFCVHELLNTICIQMQLLLGCGRGSQTIQNTMQRFEQEWEVLSTTKHPCFVQYLGTAKDPETERLVLLMELMDESLTRFLEQSTALLPYHIQLNLCYDIDCRRQKRQEDSGGADVTTCG